MTTNRQFGIEIEGFGITQQAVCDALRAAGIDAAIEGYNHQTRPRWKIVYDGSVTGTGTGIGTGWEVVSPILKGEEGIAEMIKVADALDRAGAQVDRSCGFHVHVDAEGLSAEEILTVVRRYAAFEYKIDAFMPASRRANTNKYCKSMVDFLNQNCISSASIDAFRSNLQRIHYRDREARYRKVNLQAYLRHGTIEFRQHSGTRNAQKMANWVRFCLGFVEASRTICAQNNRPAPAPAPVEIDTHNPRTLPGYRDLTRAQQNLLERLFTGEVVSVNDLCRAAACSRNGYNGITEQTLYSYMSELRAKCGVTIKKQRGGGYRLIHNAEPAYRAPTPAPAPAPALIEDSLFLGIPAEVVSFYEERAQEFAC